MGLTLPDRLAYILSRKSVRHYTGEQVAESDLDQILRAAMAAPAAVHQVPWQFLVIRSQTTLRQLEDGLPFAKMLAKAGTAIVVCVNPKQAAMGKEEFAILDGACASENILLAAEALGLGAVWTAVYPNTELMQFVGTLLGIPGAFIPLNVIAVGHPTGEDHSSDKYNQDLIHRDRW
ncbi:MAG TPA: nitroreductase family protein [Chitinophagaceae bacterium]|nr:nitroreductase family protein [Chitinophagaceae bacterium]